MNISKKTAGIIAVLGLAVGSVVTLGLQTHAQTSGTNSTNPATGSAKMPGHAPLGNDGNVTALNGTTITMQEETNEGGTSYTIDASKGTFTKDGNVGSVADIKVGDKIFVTGPVSGNNVAATAVSDGRPNFGGHGMWGKGRPNDNDSDDTAPTTTN